MRLNRNFRPSLDSLTLRITPSDIGVLVQTLDLSPPPPPPINWVLDGTLLLALPPAVNTGCAPAAGISAGAVATVVSTATIH